MGFRMRSGQLGEGETTVATVGIEPRFLDCPASSLVIILSMILRSAR
jgi:hypothetical protein